MGSLKDVVIQRETVKTAGGNFTVGPLTGADILGIFIGNRNGVQALFDAYRGAEEPDAIFLAIIGSFPEIAAEIIARGNGDFDDATLATARSLDIGAQLDALEKVGSLTVASVGGLGNLASLIERLFGTLNASMAQGGSLLTDGLNTSASSAPSSSTQDTPTPGTTHSG